MTFDPEKFQGELLQKQKELLDRGIEETDTKISHVYMVASITVGAVLEALIKAVEIDS